MTDNPTPARHVALAWAVPYVDGGFVERDGLPSFWKSREDAQEWLDDYGNPGERVVRVRVETREIAEGEDEHPMTPDLETWARERWPCRECKNLIYKRPTCNYCDGTRTVRSVADLLPLIDAARRVAAGLESYPCNVLRDELRRLGVPEGKK